MKHPRFFICIIVAITIQSATAQTTEQRSMDSLIQSLSSNQCFNGEAFVSVSGKQYYRNVTGLRNKTSGDIIQRGSVFNIGSISKPLTAVAILQLQQRRLLNIQDHVKKYLPAFPYDSIRIIHLLSHTSGLMTNIEQVDGYVSHLNENNDSVLAVLVRYKPSLYFAPGSEWGYSNIGYDLLATIIERVTKHSFQEYMHSNIFIPAGMKQSFVPFSRETVRYLPKHIKENLLLIPHMYADITACEVSPIHTIPWVNAHKDFVVGSGNVYSTVTDLEKFDRSLRNNKLLNTEMQRLMYQPYVLSKGDTAKDQQAPIPSYYALGWYVSIDKSMGTIVWHKGRSFGSRSVYLRNLDKSQTVTVTDNYDYAACDLKGIALLKILNHRSFRNPVLKSLVQEFACDIYTHGVDSAFKKFEYLKQTQRKNYYISEEEILATGDSLLASKRMKDALRVYLYSTQLFPESFVPYMWYARGLLDAKQYEQSMENYVKAMKIYSKNESDRESFLNTLGYQLITSNRSEDAERILKLNTELYPKSCNTFDSYATVLDMNGKLTEAILNEQTAVKLASEQSHDLLPELKENLRKLRLKAGQEN